MASENVEIMRRGFRALNEGDWKTVFEILDPEIELGLEPSHPEVPRFRGHDGVREFLSLWVEAWDDYRFEPEELIEAGDEVVVIGRETGRGRDTAVVVDQEVAAVWTLRDGRGAVRYRLFSDREEALKAVALGD